MTFKLREISIIVILALLLGLGCVTEQTSSGQKPLDAGKNQADEKDERIKKVFETISERNKTIKKSPEWLKTAYSGIGIKRLNDIPKEKYQSYRKYLSGNSIYFIVHPGYFAFFDDSKSTYLPKEAPTEGFPANNIAERFMGILPPDAVTTKLLKEEEVLLRDFLEFMSTEKRLVVLVLSRDYKEHFSYGEPTGRDEYARYINELTNMSDSIIYMESQGPWDGLIEAKDLEILMTFLNTVGAKKIYLGGGFLGKCLGNTYESIRPKVSYENIAYVPEITAISPDDSSVSSSDIKLINKNGRINFKVVSNYFNTYGTKDGEMPQFKNLSLYKAYR